MSTVTDTLFRPTAWTSHSEAANPSAEAPPLAAPAPSAPAHPSTPQAPSAPDIWEMPTTGMGWCDCGCGHEITEEIIQEEIEFCLDEVSEHITHPQVCRVLMELWRYESVCAFFHDAVRRSAEAVHGEVAPSYRLPVGRAIIGHFCKTWNGCPQEACDGGLGWDDAADGQEDAGSQDGGSSQDDAA